MPARSLNLKYLLARLGSYCSFAHIKYLRHYCIQVVAARVVDNEAIVIAIGGQAVHGFCEVIVSAAEQVANFMRQ